MGQNRDLTPVVRPAARFSILLLWVGTMLAGSEGTAEAEEFQISPASVMPSPTSQAWTAVEVGTLPTARFEAIGFEPLDKISYGVARVEARLILLGALLDAAQMHIADPQLAPEVYKALGDEVMGLYTAGNAEIASLVDEVDEVLQQVDDYCKKRPWKCHKVLGQAKSVVASLDQVRERLQIAITRATDMFSDEGEAVATFEGVEAVGR